MNDSKVFLFLGAVAAAAAVGFGAFGAHALKARLSADLQAVYATAVQYHFYHALGLLVIGLLSIYIPGTSWLRFAGWMMIAGMILFSGSLYVLSVTGVRAWGAVTPLGGAAFILAWLACAIAVVRAA